MNPHKSLFVVAIVLIVMVIILAFIPHQNIFLSALKGVLILFVGLCALIHFIIDDEEVKRAKLRKGRRKGEDVTFPELLRKECGDEARALTYPELVLRECEWTVLQALINESYLNPMLSIEAYEYRCKLADLFKCYLKHLREAGHILPDEVGYKKYAECELQYVRFTTWQEMPIPTSYEHMFICHVDSATYVFISRVMEEVV